MIMRRPITVVNFDKITKIIQRIMRLQSYKKYRKRLLAQRHCFELIKQALKVFSHAQFKRFDEENKESYSGRVKTYCGETEEIFIDYEPWGFYMILCLHHL